VSVILVLKFWYSNSYSRLKSGNGDFFGHIPVKCGVSEGGVLSPHIFNASIENVLSGIRSSVLLQCLMGTTDIILGFNMVLSLDELATATGSSNVEILELYHGRNVVSCFIHQCGLDRKLQKHWKSTQSIEYKFNCRILHEPTKYPN